VEDADEPVREGAHGLVVGPATVPLSPRQQRPRCARARPELSPEPLPGGTRWARQLRRIGVGEDRPRFRVIASEHGQRIEDCPPEHQGVNFLRRGANGREDDAGATVIKTH
jgi:hypothetical protein